MGRLTGGVVALLLNHRLILAGFVSEEQAFDRLAHVRVDRIQLLHVGWVVPLQAVIKSASQLSGCESKCLFLVVRYDPSLCVSMGSVDVAETLEIENRDHSQDFLILIDHHKMAEVADKGPLTRLYSHRILNRLAQFGNFSGLCELGLQWFKILCVTILAAVMLINGNESGYFG